MAKNLSIISGGQFVGNPIILEVTPEINKDIYSFLQVKVKVTAYLSKKKDDATVNGKSSSFVFSVPVADNNPVKIDISSALRVVAEEFEYSREMITYPYIKYNVIAWEEYMQDGDLYETSKVSLSEADLTSFMGAFSDKERLQGAQEDMTVSNFSRKPDTGEIVAQDEILLYPENDGTQDVAELLLAGMNGYVTFKSHEIYVIPPSKNRYHFYFLNGLGIIETIAATSLCEESKEYKQSTHILSRMETLANFSRMITRKTSSAKILKLSSGPLNKEWLEWWTDEFLMTELAWIRIDGFYYPCSILPTETTLVRKNDSSDVMEVIFTVRIQGL